ncbi:MAG: chemotaxis protein CheA, partial [Microcystaceae cyanobacterium]
MNDKEQQIRWQFLDEATEYIDTLESSLLGITHQALKYSQLDGIRRAAHSLKGGAALMGYTSLSDLAHQLEDSFKSLKKDWICPDESLERLYLQCVDHLRHCVVQHRQGMETLEENWLNHEVIPLFEQLEELMSFEQSSEGEDTPEEMDMRVLMFETEVEGCLERLENVTSSEEKVCLREEFKIAAQELGCLGEMLELPAFSSLCGQIEQAVIDTNEKNLLEIVQQALDVWRRSQAIIMIKQFDALPSTFREESTLEAIPAELSLENDLISEADSLDFLASLDAFNLEKESLEVEQQEGLEIDFNEIKTEEEKEILVEAPLIEQPEPLLATINANSSSLPSASTPTSLPPETSTDHNVRVSVDKLEQLRELFEELTIEKNGLNLQLKQLQGLIQLLRRRVNYLDGSNRSLRTLYDQSNFTLPSVQSNGDWDAMEMDSYSEIHPVFQDLMETIVQIQEVTGDIEFNLDQTQRSAKDISRTSGLLQNNLTQVRMRPFSDLVGRIPRAIREMSLKYGKNVNLKIKGESIPIDRMIMEALNEPLIHLIRNAFDHGIESPDLRTSKGKSPDGNISLEAKQRGNQIVITVTDDGKGINLEKIAEKAAKQGKNNLSQPQLLDLIFEPGFSTASEVTDLSGRGVGMDIVRNQLQRIRGQIQVSTKKDRGTTFTITVPFTLSLIRVLLVESGGMRIAIPSNTVEEMVVIAPEMKIERLGQDWLLWDNEMIPLLNLSSWLNFNRLNPQS